LENNEQLLLKNERVKKRGNILAKPKKILKSKIRDVKPFSEMLTSNESKQNQITAKQSQRQESSVSKSYQRYKRVVNPIKHII
jgi:hypothetical protein